MNCKASILKISSLSFLKTDININIGSIYIDSSHLSFLNINNNAENIDIHSVKKLDDYYFDLKVNDQKYTKSYMKTSGNYSIEASINVGNLKIRY
ncbi:hypothetical protein [Eggerthia catenaformis]|uniref:hypothetical protein n=1 Tax=Eggerthia catenaformis TaxID=31973 RepID=UPI0028F09D48|nr:hypothetical protein [Eggerthia catenaformis]